MTLANKPADQINPSRSMIEVILIYIRYGLTMIRREGLSYFFIRSLKFINWELGRIYRVVYLKSPFAKEVKLVNIKDIEYNSISRANLGLEILPIPSQLQESELSVDTTTGLHDRQVLHGISSHNQQLGERNVLQQQGRERYAGRSLLFLAPIGTLSGGANLIMLAAKTMQRMGVKVQILNLNIHRGWFERNYPNRDFPVIFADVEDVPVYAMDFNAVIATSNPTVSWMVPSMVNRPNLTVGYYIQDYEPYFYVQGSHEYKRARASYTLLPNLVRMTTTSWISDMVKRYHQVDSKIVGVHMDTDLFRPRPRDEPTWPDHPLRIVGMIRPTTPYRNPTLTMSILKHISKINSTRVEFTLFGCNPREPGFASLSQDFPYQLAGQLRPTQMVNLLNDADIFVDFSDFQAFGLTALEAMACGVAAIVPSRGGAVTYAKDEENCLVVDTRDQTACIQAVQRLIEDDNLRSNIQANAISTAARFYPERPVFNILDTLFSENL